MTDDEIITVMSIAKKQIEAGKFKELWDKAA